jgi:heme exporter protein D
MSWGSWSEFWSMGGYGLYVWGSYGVSAALIALEVAWVRSRRRRAQEALRWQGGLSEGGVR